MGIVILVTYEELVFKQHYCKNTPATPLNLLNRNHALTLEQRLVWQQFLSTHEPAAGRYSGHMTSTINLSTNQWGYVVSKELNDQNFCQKLRAVSKIFVYLSSHVAWPACAVQELSHVNLGIPHFPELTISCSNTPYISLLLSLSTALTAL